MIGWAIPCGLIAGVIGGFLAPEISPRQMVPNEGIRRSARRVLLVGFFWVSIALLSAIPTPTTSPPDLNPPGRLFSFVYSLLDFLPFLVPVMLWVGGRASLQHLALRLLLVRNRAAPWKYVSFLDEATDRLFLRKIGGGYVFVHRLLLEYFADLQEDGTKDNATGLIRVPKALA
jgi:hypothetical protein